MFENTNHSYEFDQINKDLLEIKHYIEIFLYVVVTVISCLVLFTCCMIYVHYIYINKHRERMLKEENRQNLLKYSEEKSDDL